jgi:hypothetical protein
MTTPTDPKPDRDVEILAKVFGMKTHHLQSSVANGSYQPQLEAMRLARAEALEDAAFKCMDNLNEIKKLGSSNSDDMEPSLQYFRKLFGLTAIIQTETKTK